MKSAARATAQKIAEAVRQGRTEAELGDYTHYAAYRAGGGCATLVACVRGERTVEAVLAAMEDSGLRGLGGAALPRARNRCQVGQLPV